MVYERVMTHRDPSPEARTPNLGSVIIHLGMLLHELLVDVIEGVTCMQRPADPSLRCLTNLRSSSRTLGEAGARCKTGRTGHSRNQTPSHRRICLSVEHICGQTCGRILAPAGKLCVCQLLRRCGRLCHGPLGSKQEYG